jgi:hypothetical protein
MNRRSARLISRIGVVMALASAGACSSSSPSVMSGHAGKDGGAAGTSGAAGAGAAGTNGGAGDGVAGTTGGAGAGAGSGAAGTGASQMVGTQGGTVSQEGVTLTIPSDALAADTPITIATTNAPAGYTLASAVYQFGPSGTTFAQPVTITIPLTTAVPGAHLFWSNATGGFDDLGGTVTGMMLTAQVTHFSVGFVARLVMDGGSANDAPAAGDDASTGTDGSPADHGAGSAAGAAGDGIPTIDANADTSTTPDAGVGADAAAGASGGNDAGAANDASSGADAPPAIDASGLCNPPALLNLPVVNAKIVNDGTQPPAASTYTGGTFIASHYLLSAATHYGATYSGPVQATLAIDVVNHTIQIVERIGAQTYYMVAVYTNADAHTLVGTVVCNTTPNNASQITWYYSTLQAQFILTEAGSADVLTFTAAPAT